MNGDLSFTIDERAALVCVTGRGIWSAERTATHFNNLDKALQRMRQQRGGARVLVDLREASVQTVETAQVMKQCTGRIYRDVDRVAVVCATALLALQIKHSAQVPDLATFLQVEPARAWVLAGKSADAPAKPVARRA
jgi:hypothetical protein